MRKISLIFSIVLLATLMIVFIVPLAMGLWVEKVYPEMMEKMGNTSQVSFRVINFKRGWFRSTAQLQVTVNSSSYTVGGEPLPLTQFILNQKIQHGPILFYKSGSNSHHFVLARAAIKNSSQDKNLDFNSESLWTLTDSINTELIARHIQVGNGRQRIELQRLAGDINFYPQKDRFQSAISLAEGALYENHAEKPPVLVKVLEVNDLSTSLDIHKVGILWYGNRHINAKRVTIFPFESAAITLDNWDVSINQTQRDMLTDVVFVNHIDAIRGDQVKVSQFNVNLALTGMNTMALETLSKVSMKATELERIKLYPVLMELLGKGMIIDLNKFQFITDQGPVNLQAWISSPLAQNSGMGILYFFENLDAKATIKLPKEWLRRTLIDFYQNKKVTHPDLNIDPVSIAQRYLNYWINHHLLKAEDQQFSMKIDYKKGDLLINDKKPSLSSLLVNDPDSSNQEIKTQ